MSDRDRAELAEEQVDSLIDLVMAGEDPQELIDATLDEIHEGYGGGPYPIGSRVKINTTWSGQTIEGNAVTLSQGDTVSVVQPNLGEKGQDRMVLLSDGKTRIVVPFAILGEGLEEGDPRRMGPAGHVVPPAKGKQLGSISGKYQGEAPKPESPPKPASSKKPTSIPSTFVGKGKPKDDPAAQSLPMMAPTVISGKAVEDVTDDVLTGLQQMMDETEDNARYRAINEFQRVIISDDLPESFPILHYMMHGEDSFTFDDMVEMFQVMKGMKKRRKKESFDEDDLEEMFQVMKGIKKKKKH